jgi:putative nucleotidyltransferase with HDIG domain
MLPQVATRVMQLANDPNANASRIAEVLKQDQQLAGKLINVANSPVYAGLAKITSIQRAIVQVGIKTVRDLLVGVAFGTTVFRNPQFRDRMTEMWKHSLAVAYTAQEIARTIRLDNEYAFLCGLMHDVGKPLLIDVLVDLTRALKEKAYLTDDLIDEVLAEYHPAVGGLIARKWSFPALLHDAITFHHRHDEANSSAEMARLTFVADLFYYHLDLAPTRRPVNLREEKAVYDLGLLPDQIAALEAKLAANVPMFLAGFAH